MKPIDQSPDSIDQEISTPVRSEKKKLLSKPLPRGVILWEFNLETHEGQKAQAKHTEVVMDGNGINQLRNHIEYRKDRYYCMAINLKNATRKYRRWFVANQNARRIMAAMKPTPESPSAEASQ